MLCECLENLAAHYDFDIVNVSMGVSICSNVGRLKRACEQIRLRGGIVVSAFDNLGSVSYPAAFECVIGVTNSNECHTKEEIVIYNDYIVNIGAKGGLQRVAWNMPPYTIVSGNSFACAHVTAKIAKIINSGAEGWEGVF